MNYKHLKLRERDDILEITLDQPSKRNPLSAETIAELTAVFAALRTSEIAGVILSASGPVFCAGHHFGDMANKDLAHLRTLMHACSEMMQLIHAVPQPVIASVQGLAVGAGCQLALTCDLIVASEAAAFQTAGARGGWFCFTPMVAVTRAVGGKRALEMLLAGEKISAHKAAEWGMINRVVLAEALTDETWELAQKVTAGNRQMIGMGKQAYYAQIELDEEKAYQYAAEMMASTGTMPQAQERMNTFMEKRSSSRNGAISSER